MVYDPNTGNYVYKPRGSILMPCMADLLGLAIQTAIFFWIQSAIHWSVFLLCGCVTVAMMLISLVAISNGRGYSIPRRYLKFMHFYSTYRVCTSLMTLIASISIIALNRTAGYSPNTDPISVPDWLAATLAMASVGRLLLQTAYAIRLHSAKSQLPTGYLQAPG